MKAVIATGPNGPAKLVTDRPQPKLPPTYILVKTHAVALNPIDSKYLAYGMSTEGAVLGCDYAGTILEVGSGVQKDLKVGDRVCGVMPGHGEPLHPDNGCFAEVIIAKGDIAVKIPDGVSFEEAATTGVAWVTTGRCLYKALRVPFPRIVDGGVEDVGRGRVLFIYGGSSLMGTATMQFAKLSGFRVWTVCSPRNFEMVKKYGADRVWDYHTPGIEEEIKTEAAKYGGIEKCIDCISTMESVKFCETVLSPNAIYSAIGPFLKITREDLEVVITLGYSFLGDPWSQFGKINEVNKEDHEAAVKFSGIADQLFASGQIKGHPTDVRDGLESVFEGMAEHERGEVSGKKIVVRL
jgi:NADPH:quinone reductase-like Zn-dependent oxidoreductase